MKVLVLSAVIASVSLLLVTSMSATPNRQPKCSYWSIRTFAKAPDIGEEGALPDGWQPFAIAPSGQVVARKCSIN
jgi:hypothetical protein